MSANQTLELSLFNVRQGLIELAALTDKITLASAALLTSVDSDLAQRVNMGDSSINQHRFDLEEYCYRVLQTQTLSDRQVREVVGTAKVATNLERVADYAADVGYQMVRQPHLKEAISLLTPTLQMAEIAQEMVKQSVEAFLTSDETLAESVVRRDRELEDLNEQALLNVVESYPRDHLAEHLPFIATIARDYLRMGERASNICERAIYIATGELKEFRR
ncbi:MAG: PhoU domain-containing protein [Anaerolineae bacterium]|nr:hypothetical protein [Anaerolineae bacterium]